MAVPVDPDFRARMQALADKFAARVPATLDGIEQALAACRGDGGTAGLERLHELLHGVAGTAGTFGFGMLGQQARRLEQRLREVMAGRATWDVALADEVEIFLRWARLDPAADQYVA